MDKWKPKSAVLVEGASSSWTPKSAIPVKEETDTKTIEEKSNALQKTAQVLETPIRGFRGLGVGIQKAIPAIRRGVAEPGELQDALFRAAEATKPGFKPQPGERMGAMVGEAAATAPVFAAAAPASAALTMKMVGSGLASGTLQAINDASEKGDISIAKTSVSALTGAAIPIIVPTVQMVARSIRSTARTGATAGTTMTREAADEAMKDPKLLKHFEGTADAVGKKVVKIQDTLISQHKRVGEYLNKARQRIGIEEPFEDSLIRVSNEGFKAKPPQELIGEFWQASATAEKALAKGSRANSNKALRDLYKLRENIDDAKNYARGRSDVPTISAKDERFLGEMRNRVNKMIEKLPGGKTLRMADKAYSMSRTLYDDLQKKLATRGKAEEVIQRILKGDDMAEVIGVKGDTLRLLQSLERKTRQSLIEPVRKELLAKNIRGMKAIGYSGIPAETLGPERTVRALSAADSAAGALERLVKSIPIQGGRLPFGLKLPGGLSPLQIMAQLATRQVIE